MDRAEPLIPIPVLAILIAAGIMAVWSASRPAIRQRTPWLFPESLAAASLVVLHLLFFWQPYRSATQVPAGGGDLASFFFPIHAYAASEVQAGRFPFWSPHQFGGMPHLANFQTAPLYPLNLLGYLLSDPFSYAALERLALLHFLLASFGAYWLARSIGLDRVSSVLAGTVFAYSGFMTAHLGHYSMLVTAAWAPFVYAAMVGSMRRASWPLALAGTAALVMAILGGHQPMLLLVLSGAGLITIFELWRLTGYARPETWKQSLPTGPLRQAAARTAVMLVLALGITLPALGPAFELTGFTSRSELSYSEASEYSVEPLALLHMVLPTVYGSNPSDFWGSFSNTEIWGYAGIATLVLALLGLIAGTGRTRLFWGGLLLVGLVYAIGPYSPLHGWLYAFMPGFDRVRGAGRAYFFVDLALALLAAYGIHRLSISSTRDRIDRVLAWIERGSLVAVGGLVLFIIPIFGSLVLGVNDPPNRPVIALDNLIMLTIWLTLTAVTLGLARRNLIGTSLAALLLGTIVVLDLFSVTASFNPTEQHILTGYDHPELIQSLEQQREESGPFRIDNRSTSLQPDAARLYGFDAIGGLVDPLALERYADYRRESYASLDFLREMNVRYVITDRGASEPPISAASLALETGNLIVWEVPGFRTRAWFTAEPDFALAVETPSPGQVVISTREASPGGTLVLAAVDYPGWTAEVDGKPVPIEQYRGTLQQIDIPAGEQTITFMFRPRYWNLWLLGGLVAGTVWFLLLCASTIPAVRRKAPWFRQ